MLANVKSNESCFDFYESLEMINYIFNAVLIDWILRGRSFETYHGTSIIHWALKVHSANRGTVWLLNVPLILSVLPLWFDDWYSIPISPSNTDGSLLPFHRKGLSWRGKSPPIKWNGPTPFFVKRSYTMFFTPCFF